MNNILKPPLQWVKPIPSQNGGKHQDVRISVRYSAMSAKTSLTLFVFVAIFFYSTLFLFSCRGGNAPVTHSVTETEAENIEIAQIPLPENIAVNVYIKNTGNMDGYMFGDTELKNAMSYLLVQLDNYYPNSVNVRFINTRRIDSTSMTRINLANFEREIGGLWDRTRRQPEGRGDTDLNDNFRDILELTDDRTISILFSDCIFSMQTGVDGRRFFQKNAIIKTFNDKLRESQFSMTTTIAKMTSKFNGRYFPKTGNADWFYILSSDDSEHRNSFIAFERRNPSGGYVRSRTQFIIPEGRPYYVCIFANQILINDFNQKSKLQIEDLTGYENKFVLSSEDPKDFYWSILNSTFNVGRFKIDRQKSSQNYIRGIMDVKTLRTGRGCSRGIEHPFTFAVAVDFSKVEMQVDNDYILETANYEVTTGNFEVIDVKILDTRSIHQNDLYRIENGSPTHVILLQSTTKKLNNTEVSFALKKRMPQWVIEGNTEDDTIEENLKGKTFGLRHWVEGINEAYETQYPNNKNYFECSISIK